MNRFGESPGRADRISIVETSYHSRPDLRLDAVGFVAHRKIPTPGALTGPESASDILEVARQVDSEMLSETQKNPSTRIRAAIWTAFLIANRYRELKIDLAHNQEKASRRLRRERHYTRCSHERELLALLADPTLSANERHEVLRDLGRLRGYYRAPMKRKHRRETREI